ncbi:MAG: ATP-binding protein [Candidatus Diapherotrites archaeon]|nr:ATP-binding protein [Candidatus Diapherotrites archaeon]
MEKKTGETKRVRVGKEDSKKDIFEEVVSLEGEKKEPKKDEGGPLGETSGDFGETKEESEKEELDELKEDESKIHDEIIEDLEHESGVREEGVKELDDEAVQFREEIRDTILRKAELLSSKDEGGKDSLPLYFLEDEATKSVFIGRKKSVQKQYGFEAAMLVGRVNEQEHNGKNVHLDSLNPHVVFVCGARGSGKSYALGVIAEELALKNKNVGTIVIDPIGVFWSMRFPNKEERELQKISEWGLSPLGVENIKVFIPHGMTSSVPKSTFDKGFAIQPSLLTGEDWCLTFSIDRFSVTGLLLEQSIKKTEKGYKETESGKKIDGMGKNYSLDDLINCLRTDSEINSRETGYKQDSIRALSSRFQAAKNWGIFSEKGTPLGELSCEGQLTILDTSFLDDRVTALVIGVLARRILAARKINTRKEAAQKFKTTDVEELLETDIPPTWLIVDEAHTLIPSGNEKTPASAPLTEYAKQGRRPGCSLVFATQQPSAIDTKVLSQLDVILTHKLVFDDDVKAVTKRTPTIIPGKYRKSSFIKTLPVGVALVGDRREETSRAFVMEIRPRLSQHEGRDIETVQTKKDFSSVQARQLAVELIQKEVLKEKKVSIERIGEIVEILNAKYGAGIELGNVLRALEKAGLFVSQKTVFAVEPADEVKEIAVEKNEEPNEIKESKEPEKIVQEETSKTVLLSLPIKIDKKIAEQLINGARKKKLFGFFGKEEKVESLLLKYSGIWKVKYDVISRSGKEFLSRECFINSLSGEFIHFSGDTFVESAGLKEFFGLSEEVLAVLLNLQKSPASLEELCAKTGFEEGKVHRIVSKLHEKNLIGAIVDKEGKRSYWLKEKLDLPPSERHEMLSSINSLPFVRAETLSVEQGFFAKKDIPAVLQKLWKNIVVKEISEIYRPMWVATVSGDKIERKIMVDAVTGILISKQSII